MRKYPILLLLLPLLAGILLADRWLRLPLWLALALAAGLLLACVGCHLLKVNRAYYFFIPLVAMLLGYVRMGLVLQRTCPLPEGEGVAHLRLLTEPDRGTNSWHAVARLRGERVMLYFPVDITPPCQGDSLVAYCRWREPVQLGDFDYPKYLKRKGIQRTIYLAEEDYLVVSSSPGPIVRLRHKVLRTFSASSLTPAQAGIAEAMMMGYDGNLTPDTRQRFRNAGITHLLCVSGLHVGIVASLLGGLLCFLAGSAERLALKGLLQLAGVWLFALFTGMAPATVRASVMFSFFILRRMFSLRIPPFNVLMLSLLAMLMVRPGMLFEAGFLLSYGAVLGIILYYQRLYNLLNVRWSHHLLLVPLQPVWRVLCVSIAAQIGCTPFMLLFFHQFSPYFLLANILIVPFAGLLLSSFFLLTVLAWWPWAFEWMGRLVSWELVGVDAVTRWISGFPHALVEDIYFTVPMLILSLLVIILPVYPSTMRRTFASEDATWELIDSMRSDNL